MSFRVSCGGQKKIPRFTNKQERPSDRPQLRSETETAGRGGCMPLRPAAFYLLKNAAIAEKRERQHENCKDRDKI